MKQREKILIWPTYLDANKTRSEGRKIPRRLAIESPRLKEIVEAAKSLGLKPVIKTDAAYPRTHWMKTGVVLVDKRDTKTQILSKISNKILEERKL